MIAIKRRRLLRLLMVGSATGVILPRRVWSAPWGSPDSDSSGRSDSLYGSWTTDSGVPKFVYDVDHTLLPEAEWDPILSPPTRRHWAMVGNRGIQLQAANDGTVALFDERHALRWLTAPDPEGTGVSRIDDGGVVWGSEFALRGGTRPSRRIFGPTSFEVQDRRAGLRLERTVLCPEGDQPWVLVRVRLSLDEAAAARSFRHLECWALRPRFINLLESAEQRRMRAEAGVSYLVSQTARGLRAREVFSEDPSLAPFLLGPPAILMLERLGSTPGAASYHFEGSPHPTLEIETSVTLESGESQDLWFRFGAESEAISDPEEVWRSGRRTLADRLPRAAARGMPEVVREIPWHSALLTGALSRDEVIGDLTLDQGSTYSYLTGFNGAARDPLQHALPLTYIDPASALGVLRNTCAWGMPDGDLPYALDGAKRPTNLFFRPSDQNLWALWLASEYAAATGDVGAFDELLAYHPVRAAEPVSLWEHLRRQFRFFVDVVGRGAGGHVRILNADWNDEAIQNSGVDPEIMIAQGGSVLNSAMAAWVLDVFAGLAERRGDTSLASEARAESSDLRALVSDAWNGRWFHRAYAPGMIPVGDADCWLEVQPWAILCGAASETQARELLTTIDLGHAADSPLGARLRWPADPDLVAAGKWGEGTRGGIWYSINMTLVWAASRFDRVLARDQWRRMLLTTHTSAHPEIWEGTLTGPDAWNAPESPRPGRTWSALPLLAMQAYPVNNAHSHAQPILGYLRLLGVEPTASGGLRVGSGGSFESPSFSLSADGHGHLQALGPLELETPHGRVSSLGGTVCW